MQPTTTSSPYATNVLTNVGAFTAQVFGWMTFGLFITAMVAFAINLYEPLQIWLYRNDWVLPVIFAVEFIVVIALSAMINKMNPILAAMLFVFYAALNGVFFSLILAFYTGGSIFLTFAVTGGTFGVMALYGLTTKRDLTKFGSLAFMGLVGVIIGSFANFFLQSDGLTWVLTYVGIAVFVVLTAHDTAKLKEYAAAAEQTGNGTQLAVIAALGLYLDFINLFVYLLRIFGRRD